MTNDLKNISIRFNGFTSAWEQRKFKDITYLAGEKNKENLPYESYSITNENGFVPQNEQFETGGTMREADKRMYYIVSPNSFAYNPARINVGSIGYQNLYNNVIVSSLYEVFKTSDEVNDRFLWHWFKSDAFQKMIEQYQEGGVRLYFYYDKLCKCFIDLPSIEEQRNIGQLFDTLDNLIILHQHKYDKLVNIKKSMLEKMFPKDGEDVPEIRFKGFTGAWEQRKVGDYLSESKLKGNTGDIAKKITVKLWGKGVVEKSDFGGSEHTQYYQRKEGQFIYSKLDFLNSAFGVIPKELDGYESTADLPAFNLEGLNPYFLFYRVIRKDFYLKNGMIADGSRKAKRIHANTFLDMDIKVPEIAEQIRISNFFQDLDRIITFYQQELEKHKNLKKALLERMFI
ncbi:MAG: hsdS [Anaerocolumna sp.]|jgi:type I restriction enzyme S subunit|nr:hsdS [Anaerocolumna sp.]